MDMLIYLFFASVSGIAVLAVCALVVRNYALIIDALRGDESASLPQ